MFFCNYVVVILAIETTCSDRESCCVLRFACHFFVADPVRTRLLFYAQIWSCFNEVFCPIVNKPLFLACAIKGCGTRLTFTSGTTNARQHLAHVHKEHLAEIEAEFLEEATSGARNIQSALPSSGATRWPPGRRDNLTALIVTWLCKRSRPLSLPERDTELNKCFEFATDGGYSLPCKNTVVRTLCALSGKTLLHNRARITGLLSKKVSPSVGMYLAFSSRF